MNTLLKNITKNAEEPVNLNSLEDRMCVIGDSNVRDFWKTFFDDSEFHKYKLDVNAVGGRKTSDLKHLVRYAQRFKYVIVFFGTNDLSSGLFSEDTGHPHSGSRRQARARVSSTASVVVLQ